MPSAGGSPAQLRIQRLEPDACPEGSDSQLFGAVQLRPRLDPRARACTASPPEARGAESRPHTVVTSARIGRCMTADVLTPDAVAFLTDLQREFGARRLELLEPGRAARAARRRRAARLPARDRGGPRRRLAGRARPAEIADRRVEITGPGRPQDGDQRAQLGRQGLHGRLRGRELADLGELHRRTAQPHRRARSHDLARHRREAYRLNDEVAVLFVRPRGWHLRRAPLRGRRQPISGSLFDFGLYFLRNHARNGRYFYLPKLESHLEARLWNDVFALRAGRARHTARARSRRPS